MRRYGGGVFTAFVAVVLMAVLFTGCGDKEKVEGELTFGEDKFFGVALIEQESYAQEWEQPVQITVGKSLAWTLTSGRADYVYERNLETGATQRWEWRQGEKDLIMGLAAVGDRLYASVGTGGSIQVRKLLGNAGWQTIMEFSGEDAPDQIQPTIFCVDQRETTFFAVGNKVISYLSDGKKGSVYELKEPVAFLREKKRGVIEAVTNSRQEICLYTLEENGETEKVWTLKLPSVQAVEIRTDDENMLCLAVDDCILFLNRETGEIVSRFDCMSAGVSTNLFGGLYLVSEGVLYLDGKAEGNVGVWQELFQMADGAASRTELVYNTYNLTEAMKERIVAFNQSNKDYYVTAQEYIWEMNVDNWETQLQAEIVSGNGPDIIDLYNIDNYSYASYVEKGSLEDLEPYLRQEDFYDDIFWEVQDMYRVDGKLCQVVPHFWVTGLNIHPEYAQHVDTWNYETFVKLMEMSRGKLDVVSFSTPERVMNDLLLGMEGDLFNMDERKAYFDSPEFIRMLELSREYGDGVFEWEDRGYGGEEIIDMVLINTLWMSNPWVYSDLYGDYGEDAVPYGYPTMTGEVFRLDTNFDACGIYSGSKNKEGAWEFIRTLFAEDYQTKMSGMVNITWGLRKSCWYHSWDELKASDGIGSSVKRLPPPTDEDVEYFMNLIQNIDFSVDRMGSDIRNIVMEEAGAYFAGDRSAEDTARIIQNRVQLMLDEM
ncbi:MAG: extracellular solute-binding protein [Acetatifactor sp.]|nr:extracellular solute-binding protein [Acetatifactor sp.]